MPQLLAGLAYGPHPLQVLDLFLPEKPAPRLMVFIHGGGWRGGDKQPYRVLGELLAGFGYAVALPNHRLAPDHPYPAAAIAWLLRYSVESGIRRDGIYLGGHSSGAHLAALLSTHPRYRPAAEIAGAVCISGVYDLAAYGMAADYLGPAFGHDPAVWADASPRRHVRRGLPPFFLAHAEFDFPGAGAQAEAMAAAVGAVGGHVRVVAVPARDHVTILTGVQSFFDPLAVGLAMFLLGAA